MPPPREPLVETRLDLPDRTQGKVRDLYSLDDDRVLIVATDRLSAFDVVLPTPFAGKGRLLTELATFWMRFIERQGLGPTHLLSTDADEIPARALAGGDAPPAEVRRALAGRVTIARRCRVIPIEFVIRGYLEGSGWRDYQQTGAVCGIPLPRGLRQCDRLPEPIFTPATKAERGTHDENISFDRACELLGPGGRDLLVPLRERAFAIYRAADRHARERGIIIADTKFEFGLPLDRRGEGPLLIDEALTPDSSRFWPADRYEPGRAQPSFDKQFVREYLEREVQAGRWDKTHPGPPIPPEIVEQTVARYREARDRLIA